MVPVRIGGAIAILLIQGSGAFCQVPDCSKALIVASESINSTVTAQLSSAYKMSEGEWNQRQKQFGAAATIDGVPYSGSYADFQGNIRKRSEEFHLERFEQRSYAYATSGLNDASLDAYKACLRSRKGFELFAGDMSDGTYNVHLFNDPAPGLDTSIAGSLDNPINLAPKSMAYLSRGIAKLRYAESWDKSLVIQPDDPTKEVSFTVDFGDKVDRYLLLPPLKSNPARIDLTGEGEYVLTHRTDIPHYDCAFSPGGIGGLDERVVYERRACISKEGRNLPSGFKITSQSVSISVPDDKCAWNVCPTANNEEADKRDRNINKASQCEPQPAAEEYCFRIRLACKPEYGASCSDQWKITGQAVEMKE